MGGACFPRACRERAPQREIAAFAGWWALAAWGRGAPANVRLQTKNLENDSTLTWEASPGGEATEYEVLWRATTSPEWEHVQSVGKSMRATFEISKDNVIFAVRTIDKDGHRSLPVVPVAER